MEKAGGDESSENVNAYRCMRIKERCLYYTFIDYGTYAPVSTYRYLRVGIACGIRTSSRLGSFDPTHRVISKLLQRAPSVRDRCFFVSRRTCARRRRSACRARTRVPPEIARAPSRHDHAVRSAHENDRFRCPGLRSTRRRTARTRICPRTPPACCTARSWPVFQEPLHVRAGQAPQRVEAQRGVLHQRGPPIAAAASAAFSAAIVSGSPCSSGGPPSSPRARKTRRTTNRGSREPPSACWRCRSRSARSSGAPPWFGGRTRRDGESRFGKRERPAFRESERERGTDTTRWNVDAALAIEECDGPRRSAFSFPKAERHVSSQKTLASRGDELRTQAGR